MSLSAVKLDQGSEPFWDGPSRLIAWIPFVLILVHGPVLGDSDVYLHIVKKTNKNPGPFSSLYSDTVRVLRWPLRLWIEQCVSVQPINPWAVSSPSFVHAPSLLGEVLATWSKRWPRDWVRGCGFKSVWAPIFPLPSVPGLRMKGQYRFRKTISPMFSRCIHHRQQKNPYPSKILLGIPIMLWTDFRRGSTTWNFTNVTVWLRLSCTTWNSDTVMDRL